MRTAIVILLFIGAATPNRLTADDRAFSVKDSIQMTRFEDWPSNDSRPRVGVSPNRRFFAVLTSRGLLASDQVESTLWLLDSDKVRRSIGASNQGPSFVPKVLARFAACPAINGNGTGIYGSVISEMRWAPDSRTIYFLGQNLSSERRLYKVDVVTGVIRQLTPSTQDVVSYDFANDTVVYQESRREGHTNSVPSPDRPVKTDVSSVTGVPFYDILRSQGTSALTAYDLHVITNRHVRLVRKELITAPRDGNAFQKPLEISPQGTLAVMALPVKNISSSWELYKSPADVGDSRKINRNDQRITSPYNSDPLRQYALVNLQDGTITTLGAIDARYFFYPGVELALWSHSGERLLLTNVFLPLEGIAAEEYSRRLTPCDVAVFDTRAHAVQCLAFTRNRSHNGEGTEIIEGASFGSGDNSVVLRYGDGQHTITRVYQHADDRWVGVETSNEGASETYSSAQSTNFRLTVREGLNQRPTLWAEDVPTGTSKKLWDPNPQLQSVKLGETSVYHWTDQTGYERTGGLIKPVGYEPGRRYPLVIQTHGFDKGAFMTDGPYPTAMAARSLASVGIMVLQIPIDANHLDDYEEAAENVRGYEAAIDQLVSQGMVDPKRVGIIGFSRTCWYVESALINKPTRFAAATIADGVDFSYMQYILYGTEDPISRNESEVINGGAPFGHGLTRWTQRALSFHLENVQTPLRIEAIQSSSILTEWEIYSSLQMQGKPVDLIYIPDDDHILQKPLDRLASQQGNVDWFRFWLKGEEDSDSSKALQYERWRALRKLQDADPTIPTM